MSKIQTRIKMRVLCINAEGRPDDVPANKWVTVGEIYNVVDAIVCKSQPGRPVALKLEGLDISGCGAYRGFASSRFQIVSYDPQDFQRRNDEEGGGSC